VNKNEAVTVATAATGPHNPRAVTHAVEAAKPGAEMSAAAIEEELSYLAGVPGGGGCGKEDGKKGSNNGTQWCLERVPECGLSHLIHL
jgi:hypothetical protein